MTTQKGVERGDRPSGPRRPVPRRRAFALAKTTTLFPFVTGLLPAEATKGVDRGRKFLKKAGLDGRNTRNERPGQSRRGHRPAAFPGQFLDRSGDGRGSVGRPQRRESQPHQTRQHARQGGRLRRAPVLLSLGRSSFPWRRKRSAPTRWRGFTISASSRFPPGAGERLALGQLCDSDQFTRSRNGLRGTRTLAFAAEQGTRTPRSRHHPPV